MKTKKEIDREISEKRLESRFGKKNSFTVPEGYFADLPQNIIQKIKSEQTFTLSFDHSPRTQRRWLIPAITIAVAAFIGAFFLFKPLTTQVNSIDKQVVSKGDIQNDASDYYYISHILYNLPYDHLLNAINKEDDTYLDSVIYSRSLIPDGTLKEEEVIDYLYYHMSIYDITQF